MPYFTVREVADMVKTTPSFILTRIHAGDLMAYKVGKGYRIDQEDLEEFLIAKKVRPEIYAKSMR